MKNFFHFPLIKKTYVTKNNWNNKNFPPKDPRNFIQIEKEEIVKREEPGTKDSNRIDFNYILSLEISKKHEETMQEIIDKNINRPSPEEIIDDLCKRHHIKDKCPDEDKYKIYKEFKYTINKYFICYAKLVQIEYEPRIKYKKNKYKFELANDDERINIRNEPYEFIGVVIHIGNAFKEDGTSSGHYIAYIKYDDWYLYNDETCKPSSYKEIMEYIKNESNHASPYVMLYRKVNADYFTEEKYTRKNRRLSHLIAKIKINMIYLQ